MQQMIFLKPMGHLDADGWELRGDYQKISMDTI